MLIVGLAALGLLCLGLGLLLRERGRDDRVSDAWFSDRLRRRL